MALEKVCSSKSWWYAQNTTFKGEFGSLSNNPFPSMFLMKLMPKNMHNVLKISASKNRMLLNKHGSEISTSINGVTFE